MNYYIITNDSWIEKEYKLYLDRDVLIYQKLVNITPDVLKFESSLDVVIISIVFEKYYIKNLFLLHWWPIFIFLRLSEIDSIPQVVVWMHICCRVNVTKVLCAKKKENWDDLVCLYYWKYCPTMTYNGDISPSI